jgi:hypothetical protein
MNVIYSLSSIGVFIIIIGFIVGLIKPGLFKKLLGSKFATRKAITISSIAAFLVVLTISGMTEPASVKQARLDRENAKKQSQQLNNKPTDQQVEASNTEIKEVQEKQSIDFAKEQQNDASLASGQTKVTQSGQNGEKTITYEVTYVDGNETSRQIKSETITLAAVNEITTIGTYVAPPKPVATPAPSAPAPAHTSVRVGATCKDGTHSNATGSGACSHHGGVAVWLYN